MNDLLSHWMICDFKSTLNNFARNTCAMTDMVVAAANAALMGDFDITLNDFATHECTTAAMTGAQSTTSTIGDFDTTLIDFVMHNCSIAALISSSPANMATDSRSLADALHCPHELRRMK